MWFQLSYLFMKAKLSDQIVGNAWHVPIWTMLSFAKISVITSKAANDCRFKTGHL